MSADEPARLFVDHFFRQKWRETIVILTRRFGTQHLEEVENAVQSAMLKALDRWTLSGVPSNPGGWIFTAAKNELIDKFRQSAVRAGHANTVEEALYSDGAGPDFWAGPLEDDVLSMILVCCHPQLRARESVVITLRLVCGLGIHEIGAAVFAKDEAVRKILTRTKAKIRDTSIPFEHPPRAEHSARLDRVLRIVYLLFNEGYASSIGVRLVSPELCAEAERLIKLLLDSHVSDRGDVWALAALMSFQASRLQARADKDGRLLRLAEQDRSLWDGGKIARGFHCLDRSMRSNETSKYHLEAAIAACYAAAPSYEQTDWCQILSFYDDLMTISPSPIVVLNRSVPLVMVKGPDAGIAILESLEREGALARYHLLPALMADYHQRAGRSKLAKAYFKKAADLSQTAPVRQFLLDRIQED